MEGKVRVTWRASQRSGALTPAPTASHFRESRGGAQARDDLCPQELGSVPLPTTLSHPVDSRGTGPLLLNLPLVGLK